MAYIKVNVNSILSYGDLFNSVKSRTIEIRNQFVLLVNELDLDVKNSDGVYDSVKSIVSELEAECKSLGNMAAFASKTGQVYSLMDQTAVRSEANTSVGTTTSIKLNAQKADNNKAEAPDLEKHWYTDMFSGTIDILGKDFMKEFSDKIVGLDYVSSTFGFYDLILDTYENAKEQVERTNDIQNDSSLTDSQKDYMIDKVDDMTRAEVFFDTVSWGAGVFSSLLPKTLQKVTDGLISHMGDAINSDGVYNELLEGRREIDDAKEKFENADSSGERFLAAGEVLWENVERGYEVLREVAKEYVADVANDVGEVVDKAIVQPLKKVGEGIKKLFSWW